MLTPKPFQEHDIEEFLNEQTYAGLNASTVGVGKTLVATEISRRLGSKMDIIIAPINTLDGWQRHYRLQMDREILRCGGSNDAQKAATVAMTENKPGAYFLSWEYARRIGSFDGIHPDFAIADEVHRAQDQDTKQAAAYHSLGINTLQFGHGDLGRILAMSGTPSGNRLTGYHSVCQGLWPEKYLPKGNPKRLKGGLTYWNWAKKWFNETTNQFADIPEYLTEKVPGAMVKDINYYLRHEQGYNCCSFHPRGVQEDLPKRIWHDPVIVDMTAGQKRLYKQLEGEMMAWVEGHDWPITSKGLPMINHLRLLQVCLAEPIPNMFQEMDSEGAVKTHYTVTYPLDVKSAKIDALIETISDQVPANEPLIVWTHSAAIIPALVARINNTFKSGEHRAINWDGSVSQGKRAQIKDGFGYGGPDVIVAQIESLAEGVDGLQRVCAYEMWFSRSANLNSNTQSLGRLEREGQTRAVNSWEFVCRNTVEEEKSEKLDARALQLVAAQHV